MLTSLLLNVDARCFAVQHVEEKAKDISDVTLASENDKNYSDAIEYALEMVGMLQLLLMANFCYAIKSKNYQMQLNVLQK